VSRQRTATKARGAENLSLSVWLRLIKAYNLVLREVRGRLDPDMTLPQFDVLSQLARDPSGSTPADLSRRLLVSAGNLTGIVDRLVGRGLVRREQDPGDRRKVRLKLTDYGRARVHRMQPRHARELTAILSSVPLEAQRSLREMLGRFNHALENREKRV
jgi:DNA-binding MarR family transcriptional regulator